MRLWIFFLAFFLLGVAFVVGQPCQESEQRPCGVSDVGACSYGAQYCQGGQWSVCYGHTDPALEICDNGRDDDCDGDTDEGCLCVAGEQRQCEGTTKGICRPGFQTCINGTAWSSCFNATAPLLNELCDNKQDDDCDGQVDEGCGQQNQTVQTTTNTCFNGIQDGDETGIDCGGSCRTCVSCTDGILNQGEWKVKVDVGNGTISDCGGSFCPACPTCFDGIKNQGELEVDCGGPCRTCVSAEDADEDRDGLTKSVELQKGTDPLRADTDNDGVVDGNDRAPLCPNTVCDISYGEDVDICPQDCKQESLASLGVVLLILVVLFVSLGLYLWYQFKHGIKKTASPETKKPFQKPVYISKDLLEKKNTHEQKNKIDQDLEKSFEKVEKMLK